MNRKAYLHEYRQKNRQKINEQKRESYQRNKEYPKEVKEAFAPKNHQWLTAEENLKKAAK